jgi:hypothetical protein
MYSLQVHTHTSMKKFLLLLALVAIFSLGKAQTFNTIPGNSITHTMDPDRAEELYIHFENISGQSITLRWEEDTLSYPGGWLVQVCDNVGCFNLPHAEDTMNPVVPGDSGFLKLSVIPNGFPGTLTVCYNVTDLGSGFSTQVCYAVDATGTAVESPELKTRITTSPSPANDVLRLFARQGNLEKGWVQLYSLAGDVVLKQEVLPLQRVDLNVKELEAGIYLMRYTSKSGTLTQKVVITH